MVGSDAGNNEDDDTNFVLSRAGVDTFPDENEEEMAGQVGVEGNGNEDVGFGDADYFDMKDILELSGRRDVSEKDDIIKDLKDNCISKNSISTYTSAIVLFLLYIYTGMCWDEGVAKPDSPVGSIV